jgi:DNA-binding transcriptional regulator YiaG
VYGFNNKIQIDKETGCWNWIGYKDKDGYGKAKVDGKFLRMHRLSYMMQNGIEDLPATVLVRHSCDNPACCNPEHLLSGDKQDNSNDMKERKRQTLGERNPNSRLTESDVLEIRKLIAEGMRQQAVADRYGVSNQTVSAIHKRHRWAHL